MEQNKKTKLIIGLVLGVIALCMLCVLGVLIVLLFFVTSGSGDAPFIYTLD